MDAQQIEILRYQNNRKSVILAYILWLIVGALGAHRFYTDRFASGMIILTANVLFLASVLSGNFIGVVGLVILYGALLRDAFLIPGWIRDCNNAILDKMLVNDQSPESIAISNIARRSPIVLPKGTNNEN